MSAQSPNNLPVPQFEVTQPALFIEHPVEGGVIPQRPGDGYINATLLCSQVGKYFANYRQSKQTQAFLEALATVIGIPITGLIEIRRGGNEKLNQGTWVHPRVAINLAQWLSPAFAVQVTQWVIDWTQGKGQPYMPVHVRRYLKNKSKVPLDYFSMLNEIYLNLFAPLEDYGIIPPNSLMPDISAGRMFSDFLRQMGINPNDFPTYEHEFTDPSRLPVNARLYPIEYLASFRHYFHEVWLPKRAEAYFAPRFPAAVPYLPRILQLPAA